MAIAHACDGHKDNMPEIIDVLLNVFDSKTALVNVMKALIDKEVSSRCKSLMTNTYTKFSNTRS